VEDLFLQLHQESHQEGVPVGVVPGVALMGDVVDVLHEDHVALQGVEVFQEGAVAAGAEEKLPVGRAGGGAAGVQGDGVGGGALEGEGHLEPAAAGLLQGRNGLGGEALEGFHVLRRGGEVDPADALAIAQDVDGLDEVLLEGGAGAAFVAVEREDALGRGGVVEAVMAEKEVRPEGKALLPQGDGRVLAPAGQGFGKSLVEREVSQVAEELQDLCGLLGGGGGGSQFLGGLGAAGGPPGGEVLEHAGGGAGGGDKLAEAAVLPGLVEDAREGGGFLGLEGEDAVVDAARAGELRGRGWRLEERELAEDVIGGEAPGGDFLEVPVGEWARHGIRRRGARRPSARRRLRLP
jgi:hypothetical protein